MGFGRKTSDRQLECIAVAERLRETAWSLEKSNQLPMAERYYRRVIEINKKELGDHPLTANAIGDLARLRLEENNAAEAITLFSQALAIYDKFPDFVDFFLF